MKIRCITALLWIALCLSFAGCARDPFACCDGRKSLADWFDECGPTGCGCQYGHCHQGYWNHCQQ